MVFLKRLFAFYINASIHVSLAVCALVGVTAFEFNLEIPTALWGFVFFGSITGYNFVKYAEAARLHHRSLAHTLRAVQVFSFFSFCLLLFFISQLSLKTLVAAGTFALLTLFYAVPFFQRKNLRAFFGLKIFIVAMVWAGVTVIVPIIASKNVITHDVYLTFLQRFLMVIALTLPFEIRDLREDALSLGTLPQRLGLKRVKWFGIGIMTFALAVELLKTEISPSHWQSLIFIGIGIGWALFNSKKEQPKYYASFWVESIPLFWVAVLILLAHFHL